MSGSDEVGVHPGRVRQAAGALENLRDVLAANVPTIVSTMNEYWSTGAGSPISLSMPQQAQSRSVDDATEMRTRAQLAREDVHPDIMDKRYQRESQYQTAMNIQEAIAGNKAGSCG